MNEYEVAQAFDTIEDAIREVKQKPDRNKINWLSTRMTILDSAISQAEEALRRTGHPHDQ